jgi:glycosyltransferase involved in cell wall biosynthesis
MAAMQTLLYFYPIRTSFVVSDEEILSEKYLVRRFYFNGSKKILTPYYFLLQVLFLVYYIFSSRKFVSQFSGYHSFLPSLFGRILSRPHYIILHGTECNNFPEYRYGYLIRPLLFWFSKKSLEWATQLLPVSNALVSTEYTYKDTQYNKQGFLAFYKKLKTPYTVIHNGISSDKFSVQHPGLRNPNTFITVATGLGSMNRRGIKGLDLIISLAKLTPENHYTFIGEKKPSGLALPANVNVIDFIPHDELVHYYHQHAFYLQLSVSEGFGISVCEAMLSGCVPIVSNVGVLPEIAGKDGYVLNTKDELKLKALVEQAQKKYAVDKMERCRDHVIRNYDLSIRKAKLLSII